MRLLLTLILIFTFQIVFGQAGFINSPMVIGNAGETWVQNDYNLSFTVGQIAIETHSQYPTIFTQGFHQDSYQITKLNNFNNNFNISVFPNPASDNINIDYDTYNARADIFIKDIRGATIYYSLDFPTNKRQTLDISRFSAGIYTLEIILNSKNKIVYQIQKLN